jgi:hypothetical protein
MSRFLEGKGVGTTEFRAFSDTVDRIGAKISWEGALRHERVSDRKDLVSAESDLLKVYSLIAFGKQFVLHF